MVWNKIRKSWRIWVAPLILYFCFIVAAGLIFQYVASSVQSEGETIAQLEDLLSYGICGCLLITCWIIMKRFEKIEGRQVRKRTKAYLKFFLAIYLISLIITLTFKLLL
jgi:hypothetical protein